VETPLLARSALRKRCRFCARRLDITQGRRLCRRCHKKHSAACNPERTFADSYRAAPLPAERTAAVPGTAEKIRVFQERLRRGESIFHPGDLRFAWPRGDDR
jgi:hypothetical protein